MKTLLVIAACIFIAATALPLIREDDWWIRVFDFPRAQIAVGALIVAAAFFCLYYDKKSLFQNVLLGTLLASIIYQSCKMYPYTFLAFPQTLKSENDDPRVKFSLLSSNILMYNRDAERFLKVTADADPDIICVLQLNKWWEERLRVLEKITLIQLNIRSKTLTGFCSTPVSNSSLPR